MIIITSDNQQFNLPNGYYSGSNYFKIVESYKDNEFLSLTSPPIQFSLEEMELLNIPVNILDHNQVLIVHSIDQFFQHRDRLNRVELRLVSLWIMGLYANADIDIYQQINSLVSDAIFSNTSCAVKIYLRDRYRSFYNHRWTTLNNRLYWVNVRDNILEHVEVEDLHLVGKDINPYEFDRHIRMIERLNTRLDYYRYKVRAIRLAIQYVAWIRGYYYNYSSSLMALIRFEDLDNPQLNRLFIEYVTEYWKSNSSIISGKREYTVEDYLRDLEVIYRPDNYSNNDNTLNIFSNNDERVILHILTILGKYEVRPSNRMLSNVTISPVGIKLLKISGESLRYTIIETYRQDVVREFCDSSIINISGINWYDDVSEINKKIKLDEILKMPNKISRIECLSIFQFDEELAHLLAELGGIVKYTNLSMHNINARSLQFVISHIGNPDDSDIQHLSMIASNSHSDATELLASIGVMSKNVDDVDESIELKLDDSFSEYIESLITTTRIDNIIPAGIDRDTWNNSTRLIDNGNIELIAQDIRELHHNYHSYHSMIRYHNALIEYMRLTNKTDELIAQVIDVSNRINTRVFNEQLSEELSPRDYY